MPRNASHAILSGLAAGIIYIIISLMTGGDFGGAIWFALILAFGTSIVSYVIHRIIHSNKG